MKLRQLKIIFASPMGRSTALVALFVVAELPSVACGGCSSSCFPRGLGMFWLFLFGKGSASVVVFHI